MIESTQSLIISEVCRKQTIAARSCGGSGPVAGVLPGGGASGGSGDGGALRELGDSRPSLSPKQLL